MLHDKATIAATLNDVINDTVFENDKGVKTSINDLLTPQQKYQLLMSIINGLPKDDFECVLDFHDKFNVLKEDTHVVSDFNFAKLRFKLILEETMELGFALGFSKDYIYRTSIDILGSVFNKNIKPSLTEVADALTDILFVTYGAFDVFDLEGIQHKLMQEVYSSNMSKLVKTENNGWVTVVEKTVQKYKQQGISVISEKVNEEYVAIMNKDTKKILKPVSYKRPELELIIHKYLNK